MPSFFDRINIFQAPEEEGSDGGGGFVPPEREKKKPTLEDLEVGKTWIAEDGVGGKLRIHIDSIDPPRVSRYGTIYDKKIPEKLYGSAAELQEELRAGGFELRVNGKKDKHKNGGGNGESGSGAGNNGTNSEDVASSDSSQVGIPTAEAQITAPAETAAPIDPALPDKDVAAGTSPVAASEAVSSSPEATVAEGTLDILEQLAPERAKLGEMMDGYMEEIRLRGRLGWISSLEETKLRRMWDESDAILKKTITSFQEKGIDPEKARKELELVRVNLPIVYTRDGDKAGFDSFEKKQGAEEVEIIGNILRGARDEYFQSFPKGKIPKEANKYWKKYVLPELEDEVLVYMNETTKRNNEKKKARMNRGAIQMILTDIAIADSKSK